MNFIINKEQYLAVKAAWKQIPEAHRSATEHIFYNVLRGFDPQRGFTPIKSEAKIRNGAQPWQSYKDAKYRANYILQPPFTYTHDKPERIASKAENYKKVLAELSRKYGVEFTPELIAKIQEVLK